MCRQCVSLLSVLKNAGAIGRKGERGRDGFVVERIAEIPGNSGDIPFLAVAVDEEKPVSPPSGGDARGKWLGERAGRDARAVVARGR